MNKKILIEKAHSILRNGGGSSQANTSQNIPHTGGLGSLHHNEQIFKTTNDYRSEAFGGTRGSQGPEPHGVMTPPIPEALQSKTPEVPSSGH